jgi:hypothetical protein
VGTKACQNFDEARSSNHVDRPACDFRKWVVAKRKANGTSFLRRSLGHEEN